MNLILFDVQRDSYELPADDYRHRHIADVLNAVPGGVVRIGVVNGAEGEGIIEWSGKEGTAITARWSNTGRPSLPVHIIVGHPRPPVLQRVWRDLAAMRVARISVFIGDLSERSYLGSSVWGKTERLLREGLSQGRHTALPKVERYRSIRAALAMCEEQSLRFVGAPGADGGASLRDMLSTIEEAPHRGVIACIGPERGFSDAEREILDAAAFEPVSLGDSVLRTETATSVLAATVTTVLC